MTAIDVLFFLFTVSLGVLIVTLCSVMALDWRERRNRGGDDLP